MADHDLIESIFQEAADLPSGERPAYLNDACKGDSQLRSEVEELLSHMDVALGEFLEQPFVDRPEGPASAAEQTPVPDSVGSFVIVRRIAEGGMGVVYEARQESLDRPVAVKVLRHDAFNEATIRRFRREASLLARLHHPGIAHIYEAGGAELQFPDGSTVARPYFAMELIDGQPLTHFARQLALRPKLELFVKVCDAVHFAHEQGVIHRDLKPANILVDTSGQPKVLDFGVARVTGADLRTVTLQTQTGMMIGTLPYMSPEQIAGQVSELDERCDVYALGVILYELLSGELPLDVAGQPLFEASRIIQEEEPTSIAERVPDLSGDVATIVHTALLKEKDRRYASVGALREDVRAYLADRPITARPVSRIYRLRKFARRNREVVAGVMVAFLALVLGTVVAIHQAVKATRQAHAAQGAREEAEASLAFLSDMLTAVDPEDLGREVLVADVLERAALAIEKELAQKPAIEGRIRLAVGEAYEALGHEHDAVKHGERALALLEEAHGLEDPRTLTATTTLADFYVLQGRGEEAESLLNRTLPLQEEILGPFALQILNTRSALAESLRLQERFEESEQAYLDLIDDAQQALGAESIHTLMYRENLARLYDTTAQLELSVEIFEDNLTLYRQHLGEEHPRTVNLMSTLASALPKVDRFEEARELFWEALTAQEEIYGLAHSRTLETLNNMAVFFGHHGPMDDAEQLFRQVVEGAQGLFGPDDWRTLQSTANLGAFLIRNGKHEEAKQIVLGNIENQRRVLGPRHDQVAGSLSSLFHCSMAEEEYEDALRNIDESIAILIEIFTENSRHVALKRVWRVEVNRKLHRNDEAKQDLLELLPVLVETYGNDHPRTQNPLRLLADVHEALGEEQEAAETRARLVSP